MEEFAKSDSVGAKGLAWVKEDAEDPNTKKRYVTYCISNGSALNFIVRGKV